MASTVDLLKRCPLFKTIGTDELKKIAKLASSVKVKEGRVIFQESDVGNDIYVVVEGEVSIQVRLAPHGSGYAVHTIDGGGFLGELALVDGLPRSATARALVKTSLLRIDGQALKGLMDSDHTVGYAVMQSIARILSSRVRRTTRKLRDTLI